MGAYSYKDCPSLVLPQGVKGLIIGTVGVLHGSLWGLARPLRGVMTEHTQSLHIDSFPNPPLLPPFRRATDSLLGWYSWCFGPWGFLSSFLFTVLIGVFSLVRPLCDALIIFLCIV